LLQLIRPCIASLILAGCVTPGATATPASAPLNGRVKVIAHRGASAKAPENTMPAFAAAIAAEIDYVELDYHHTADDELIVLHDATLDRTTDHDERTGEDDVPVASQTLEALRTLDAGRWFGAAFAGTRLPTLAESLQATAPHTPVLVERKAGDARACMELLRREKWEHRVMVQAFDWSFLADLHALMPRLPLAALGKEDLDADKLDAIAATGARTISWRHSDLTAAAIAAAHARGLEVWAYTVDDPARIRRLVSYGVDGIITNDPVRTKSVLAVMPRPLAGGHDAVMPSSPEGLASGIRRPQVLNGILPK
jgi:glycerophosphoryl diester phosphodiesterase